MYVKRALAAIVAMIMILGVMPVYASGYSIEVGTELFGNISYDKNITFDTTVSAPSGESITLISKAVDEYGIVRDEDRQEISVPASGTAQAEVTINTGAYGVFKLETYMYSNNALVHTDKTDFSVVKTTEKVNDEVGIHMLFQNDADHRKYVQEIFELYDKCGYSTVREGWLWREVERTKGSYKLNTLMKNQLILLKQNPDKDMLLTLGYGSSLHTGGDATPAKTETQLKAWYDYCYNLALLTKGEPISFEVYNEYDMVGTPEEYYALLKNAHTAVKAANPQAKVYGMVTSWTAEWWISRVLDLGGGQYLDGVSIHPYAWSQSPEEFESMDKIASVRNLMNGYGLNNKELIISEIGWYKMVGREKQASYHVRFLALNKVRSLLDKTIYFRYARSLATENNEEFGFIENANADVPFSAFPVFPAMVNYNDIMTDAAYHKTVDENVYMYKLSNGKSCIMMWNDDTETVSLDLGVNSVVLTDMYGNEQTVCGTGGKYTFISSSNISYITGDFTDAKICEGAVAPDKGVAVNYANGYAVTEISNSGGMSVELSPSENVIAYTRENSSGNKELVTACDGKGYVDIKVMSGDKCVFSGREHIQGRAESQATVYDSKFDEFDVSYMHGIWLEEEDGEEVICISSTNDEAHERAVISRPFRESAGKYVSISADVRFSGNADLCITAEGGGTSVQLLRALKDGRFGYGADGAYETDIGYTADKWYNLECILNLSAKTAYYYVDGEYLGAVGKMTFPAEIEKVFIPVHTDTNIRTYVKDFRVKRYMPGALAIEGVAVASDNSYGDVSFSEAIMSDTDLAVFGICDVNSGKLVPISRIEKLTPSSIRIIPEEPFVSGGLYAVTADRAVYGAGEKVFDGKEFVFSGNKEDNLPKVLGVYSVSDKMRTRLNGFCTDGDIVIELSDKAAVMGEVKLGGGETANLPFYTEGRYIIASPDGMLEDGDSYSLSISGFKDNNGNSFSCEPVRFTASDKYLNGAERVSGIADTDGATEYFSDGFESYSLMSAEYPKDTYSFIGDKWSWEANIGGPWQGLGAQIIPANGGKAIRLVNWNTDRIAASKLTAKIGRRLNVGVVDVYFDAAVYNPSGNAALNYLEVYLCGDSNMPVMKISGDSIMGYINGSWADAELAKTKKNDINEFGKYRITFDFDNGEMMISALMSGEYKMLLRTEMTGSEGKKILQNGFDSVRFSQYRHNDSTAVLNSETASVIDNVGVYRRDEANRLSILKNGKGVVRGDISQGDKLTFRCEVNNRDGESMSYRMFIAYYSGERLVKVEQKTVDIAATEKGIIAKDFDSEVPEGDNILIKCMLFSAGDGLTPEGEAVYR